MNILRVIFNNLVHKPITLRFPERAPLPEKFRGLVQIDTDKCIGCGICAYVCVDSAIKVTDHDDDYEWAYDPGFCTFCERCVQFCPVSALTMEAKPAPAYTRRDELQQIHHMTYPVCPECGQPAHAVSDVLLSQAFSKVTDEFREWVHLCDRCRRRRYQKMLKDGYKTRSQSNGR